MKAKDARILTEKYNSEVEEKIFQALVKDAFYGVKERASVGHSSYQLDVNVSDKAVERLIVFLQGEGYKVNRNKGCDGRDGTSWDYLTIEW